MRPLSLNGIKHALLFFGALLIGFYAEAVPACRDIGGIQYCNVDYWLGSTNLVGEERVSSLPLGEVTIVERNYCPSNHRGGTLVTLQQTASIFSNAILVDGEIWGEYPPGYPPGTYSQVTGPKMSSAWPNIQLSGQTITYKNIISTAMHY